MKKVALLGAPIEIGASQRGTLMGPAALRTAGLLTLLDALGFAVEDHGDLSIGEVADLADEPPDSAKHYREIQRWTRAVEQARLRAGAVRRDPDLSRRRPLAVDGFGERRWRVTGGKPAASCSCSGSTRMPTTTRRATTLYGQHARHVGGVPVRRARARRPAGRRAARFDRSRSARTVRHRARSTGWKRSCCASAAISVADMRQIDEFGVGVLIRRVIDKVKARNGVLHVSFDVDFLDPSRRARRRHHGAGRGDLSRGASGDGVAARFRAGAIGRHRRAQSVPRRARPHRAHRGRTDRQPVRPADHRPADAEQRDRRRASESTAGLNAAQDGCRDHRSSGRGHPARRTASASAT